MGSKKAPSAPSAGPAPTEPVKKPDTPCEKDKCKPEDYDKQLSATSYAKYFRKYKKDGTEYTAAELPALALRGKIYVPVKSGGKVTVEIKFKTSKVDATVTDDDVTAAKQKVETGVKDNWNGKFTVECKDPDPDCPAGSYSIEYKVTWVTSGEDYTVAVHETYAREGVTGVVMDVSKTTTSWIYAHEFGHCIGLPDEYSYVNPDTESVKYIKPDGTLDAAVSAPYNGKPSGADSTIMSTFNNLTTLNRHAWNVAIEVQELLTSKLGRKITCTIK